MNFWGKISPVSDALQTIQGIFSLANRPKRPLPGYCILPESYGFFVNGKNPIVAHEFLGDNIDGKDVIIIDDMISSGGSMIDTAKQLKKMNAKRVFICCTFGLFTDGLGDVQPYEGSALQYLMYLQNNFPEKSIRIAELYRQQ